MTRLLPALAAVLIVLAMALSFWSALASALAYGG